VAGPGSVGLVGVDDSGEGGCYDLTIEGEIVFYSQVRKISRWKLTTLFTVGAFFLMDLRIPVVPMIAGSRSSF
jgi:hypothetical protein